MFIKAEAQASTVCIAIKVGDARRQTVRIKVDVNELKLTTVPIYSGEKIIQMFLSNTMSSPDLEIKPISSATKQSL